VANSLYTDKHVFVRELVSNASDALEKLRHKTVAGEVAAGSDAELAINITTDDAAGTITLTDNGIGMEKGELIDNLGTIARSGSKAFMAKLKESKTAGDVGSNIIGQFGVGFYSAFMVSDKVEVFSQSANAGATAHCWRSAGDGSYTIAPAEGVSRGTKIVIHLKDGCKEFANPATVKDILSRYSSFISFPILLNGKQVNTVGAIWTKSKDAVTEEQYAEFYKYKSGDFEAPQYRLHFSLDAPIAVKALLFVGSSHEEKYGMGRIKPGVDLYSRRILIEAGSRIMPDWLRFVHGVVDSEDIPLNISRESMQDSALMKRLKAVLTRRVLRFLEAEARKEPEKYAKKFFAEFGTFLKEGAITDNTYSAEIARLLRFESSALPAGTLTSLDEYISRMWPGQKDIYYLVAPHRGIAETSPYMEAFRLGKRPEGTAAATPAAADGAAGAGGDATAAPAPAPTPAGPTPSSHDVEVLYLFSPLDDFVMNNLREFNGRKMVTAETAELDPAKLKGVDVQGKDAAAGSTAGKAADGDKPAGGDGAAPSVTPLTDTQVGELGSWLQSVLPKRLSKVKATMRLKSSPAVVTDHESAAVRRMMRMVEQSAARDSESVKSDAHMLPPQTLEINPAHPVIVRLHTIRTTEPDTAKLVAEQLLDNALVAAGLVDDSRTMLPRLNALLERVLAVSTGSYKGAEDLLSRRHVPDKERQEVAGIEAGRAAADAAVARVAAKTAADASASAAGASAPPAGTAGGSSGGFDMGQLDSLLREAEKLAGEADKTIGKGQGKP